MLCIVELCNGMSTPSTDSGYDITDHRTVDPMFGRDIDLEELIFRAHALNLKIILDFVGGKFTLPGSKS